MNKLEKSILDISSNNYEALLSLKNVHGVGLGYKWINRKNTFEPCIHVLVNKKLDSNYIPSNNVIPKTFMGIKTDVIETGTLKFCSGNPSIPEICRPLQGGCNIFIEIDDAEFDGTLGCIVTKIVDGIREFFILSNNHVIADFNEAPLGTPVFQSNYFSDTASEKDIVASLTNFIRIEFIKEKSRPINYVDCAIAKILDKSIISNSIIDVGEIKGSAIAILNEEVTKVGYMSGLQTGTILTVGATETVDVSEEISALFKDQIFADLYSLEGDSGAVVLNNENKVIGLFMSYGEAGAVINNINRILEMLNIEIYTS